MNKHHFFTLISIGLFALASSAASAKDTVTFATYLEPAHLSSFWPLLNGKITSDKVKVEVRNVPIEAASQAMATKQFDIFEVGALSPEAAARQGLDLKMVGTGLRYAKDPVGFGIWVRADSNLNSVQDLRGKKLGSYALQSTVFTLQRAALKELHGLNVALSGGDVSIVQLPAPALPSALATGNVDAATFSHLQSYDALRNKALRLLVNGGKDFERLLGVSAVSSILVAYPDRLNAKPEVYQEALRMLKASVEYTRSHPDEVFTAVSSETKVPVEFFKEWHDQYGKIAISVSANDVKAIAAAYNKAKTLGLSSNPPDVAQMVWQGAVLE